jgi:hypothetical protein
VREWEINRDFEDVWIAKLPWAEVMLRTNRKVNMIKCCVCLQIANRNKFLVSKFDSLQKHVGRNINVRLQNQIITRGSIKCLLNHSMQRMNSSSTMGEKIQWLTWLLLGMWLGRKKRKFIQFVTIFWLLKQGHHVTNFEAMKLLFEFSKVKHTLKKH